MLEFEYFIKEHPPVVQKWAEEKRAIGAKVVSSHEDILVHLMANTQAGEPIVCRVSGAWLEICIQKSVQELLSLRNNPDDFLQPDVQSVIVDLHTCYSHDDTRGGLSADARRNILTGIIGIHAIDPRLTLLP